MSIDLKHFERKGYALVRGPGEGPLLGLGQDEDPTELKVIRRGPGGLLLPILHDWRAVCADADPGSPGDQMFLNFLIFWNFADMSRFVLQAKRLNERGQLNTALRRQIWGIELMRHARAIEEFGKDGATIDMV
jgi:hypothetical protein